MSRIYGVWGGAIRQDKSGRHPHPDIFTALVSAWNPGATVESQHFSHRTIEIFFGYLGSTLGNAEGLRR